MSQRLYLCSVPYLGVTLDLLCKPRMITQFLPGTEQWTVSVSRRQKGGQKITMVSPSIYLPLFCPIIAFVYLLKVGVQLADMGQANFLETQMVATVCLDDLGSDLC